MWTTIQTSAGNVVAAAYLDALAITTARTITRSTPGLVYAPAAWAVELLAADHPVSEYALCPESTLRVRGASAPITAHALLFPVPRSLHSLLEAVGIV